jgi:hypothetical protein
MAVSPDDTDIQESRCRAFSQCTGALSASQGSFSGSMRLRRATRNVLPYSNYMDEPRLPSVVPPQARLLRCDALVIPASIC